MIPTKTRESRRVKTLKLPKNLERLYRERKCRDCVVMVTRMDFAKILGKFTKVKIQYESSSTPKARQNSEVTSTNSNARLKSNENGMVLVHRNSYNQHPAKELLNLKKSKQHESTAHNILKENNRLKKPILKDKNSNYDQKEINASSMKKYGIVFEDPLASNNNHDISVKITLSDLLPQIVDSILPSDDWCIDYFPKSEEPKDDKVYDRIAAELEDLMYNEKPILKSDEKTDATETKVDDFPSIMDILNDNSSESKPTEQNTSIDFKPNLESSDVEAMLLGKPNSSNNATVTDTPTPMEVDNSDVGNLIEDVVNQLNDIEGEGTGNAESDKKLPAVTEPEDFENPNSPSILDEALQKGIEEHLPAVSQENPDTNIHENPIPTTTPDESTNTENIDTTTIDTTTIDTTTIDTTTIATSIIDTTTMATSTIDTTTNEMETDVDKSSEPKDIKKEKSCLASISGITHVVFKKTKSDSCYKIVTCPKNLKYGVELDGKSVEFLGAPKYISSLEDLQVLLQIVNESELESLYVLH